MKAAIGVGAIAVMLLAIGGCGTTKVSEAPRRAAPTQPINTIAMAPSGGLLADALGVELFNAGYQVIDTAQFSALMVRADVSEYEILAPQNLTKLQAQGIDAVLSAKAAADIDGNPKSASVRLTSTRDGQLLAGLTWQNAWGGMSGSVADRVMKKDLTAAAEQIANELVKQLPPK